MQYDIQVSKNSKKTKKKYTKQNWFDVKQNFMIQLFTAQDRRRVYAILEGEGIEIPRYAVLDRDSSDPKRKLMKKLSTVYRANYHCALVYVFLIACFLSYQKWS